MGSRSSENAANEKSSSAEALVAAESSGLGYRFVKRTFDIVFAGAVCVVGLIPSAILCAAITIDSPGSPIFRQERVGLHGRKIGIFKFRTMVADAHEHPERYMTAEQLETWKREQKLDNDPRITRIGKLLRRTSLDEIPQFFNVLLGDLSVIGPRPVTISETYEFGENRDEFLSVRPGITGWWQATERNDATWENGRRQELELYYVRHAGFGIDARVFVKTFKALGRGK